MKRTSPGWTSRDLEDIEDEEKYKEQREQELKQVLQGLPPRWLRGLEEQSPMPAGPTVPHRTAPSIGPCCRQHRKEVKQHRARGLAAGRGERERSRDEKVNAQCRE